MRFVLVPPLILLISCSSKTEAPPMPEPEYVKPTEGLQQKSSQDHVVDESYRLRGHIWDVVSGRWTQPEEVVERLRQSDFVFLGEKHDNMNHHYLQAYLIKKLRVRRANMSVAFEQIETDADESTWSNWEQYIPVYTAAKTSDFNIIPIGLPQSKVTEIYRHGYRTLDPKMVYALELNKPQAPRLLEEAKLDIQKAHCHQAREEMLEPMAAVQRARDAYMAYSLYSQDSINPAIFIVGMVHARKNRGIPIYLKKLEKRVTITSINFQEIKKNLNKPTDYIREYHDHSQAFDYIWFTDAVDFQDPCEKYKDQIERLRNKWHK